MDVALALVVSAPCVVLLGRVGSVLVSATVLLTLLVI